MSYKKIQPEVIVGLGTRTIFKETEPPFLTIISLHIDLEDWLGDDLMECFPVLLVSNELKIGLENSNFTGFQFHEMEVTKAQYFNDNYQLNKELPKFYWMKIIGEKGLDDMIRDNTTRELFVKNTLIEFLKKKFIVKYMEVNPERNEFDDLLDKMIASE